MIGILDYGMGNIQSVSNAFQFLNAKIKLVTPREINTVNALVLPGVGAFKDTALALNPYKKELLAFLKSGKPFLGICVGLQYLFEVSTEHGRYEGLGFFNGSIQKLSSKKLPQIGWNTVKIKKETPILKNIVTNSYVYYINSYSADTRFALAVSTYGTDFAAVVGKNNVFATQFHPEKSGRVGIQLLNNFIEVTKQCL